MKQLQKNYTFLTHKQLETHEYVLSTSYRTGVLVQKHQAFSIRLQCWINIHCVGSVSGRYITFIGNRIRIEDRITFWKQIPCYLRVKRGLLIDLQLMFSYPTYVTCNEIFINEKEKKRNVWIARGHSIYYLVAKVEKSTHMSLDMAG